MNGVSVAPTPKDCLRKSAQCSITIDPGQGQSEYYFYSRTKGAYRQGNSLVLFVATRTSSLFHKRLRAHHGFCENLLPYNHDSYEPIKSQIYICYNTWIVEVCAKFWTDGIIISPITATGFFKTWITSSFGLCEMGHNDVLESKVIHADKVTSATTCSMDMLNLHAGIYVCYSPQPWTSYHSPFHWRSVPGTWGRIMLPLHNPSVPLLVITPGGGGGTPSVKVVGRLPGTRWL